MTQLEHVRDRCGLTANGDHHPAWRVDEADSRFAWLMDGDRGVALLDRQAHSLELRCVGPASDCPPAVLPRHYHIASQVGVRILYLWRLKGKGCGEPSPVHVTLTAHEESICIEASQPWSDGSVGNVTMQLRYDAAWDRYVVDARADLRARRVMTALEYCNVLPAGIGDSRPEYEKYPHTFWSHPDGCRMLIKNPLWFNSVAAQDLAGEKRVAPGGFVGFGPEDDMNPVIEVVDSAPATGCMTCDALQDEHVMVLPPDGRHAVSGWYRLHAHYRLYSIPRSLADHLIQEARLMTPGAFLAWKFQYPPITQLPDDLTGVALPGSPFYGTSDWREPIPWDAPYNGRLWTASPDPAAPVHYDRAAGAIRLTVSGQPIELRPGSGHSLYTRAGQTYRLTARIRTEGQVRAGLKLLDLLYRPGDGRCFESDSLGADTNWTQVSVEMTARGDDAPFAETILWADGHGRAWFRELAFTPISACQG